MSPLPSEPMFDVSQHVCVCVCVCVDISNTIIVTGILKITHVPPSSHHNHTKK